MSEAIKSPIEVLSCGCEENIQLRHRNHSLQEQLQYLIDYGGKELNENEPMFLVDQNQTLREKNDQLEADNTKLRQEVEIFEKLDQQLFNELIAKKEELRIATQKITMITERLETELEAKQAFQAEYDLVKADQQKFLLRELRYKQEVEDLRNLYRKAAEQNEKLLDEIEIERLIMFGGRGVLDQTCRSLNQSLEEAIANQNEVSQMNFDIQKQGQASSFKPLLVGFLVTVTMVCFVSIDSISVD